MQRLAAIYERAVENAKSSNEERSDRAHSGSFENTVWMTFHYAHTGTALLL